MKSRVLMVLILIVGIFFAGGTLAYMSAIGPVDVNDSDQIYVKVPAGYGTIQIANLLDTNGLLKNKNAFRVYARINGLDGKMKEGEYYLSRSMSVAEIAERIVKGQVIQYSFTIPEGYTVRQIAATLAEKGYVNEEKFLTIARTETFDIPFDTFHPNLIEPLEGYLYPDTYSYARGMDERAIIRMMVENFKKNVSSEMVNRSSEIGYSMQEIITIASLVEREARMPNERKIVASVIYNRLKINMRLQLCASVMYILPEPKSVLLYSDLEIDSPYNTYRNGGLPPGPVSNPGKASIEAALYPDNTPYYYFVARNDGSHVFTRTLAEHNQAIEDIRGK